MFCYLFCILGALATAGTALGFPLVQSATDLWKLPLLWLGFSFAFLLVYALFALVVWLIFLPRKTVEKESRLCRFLLEYTLDVLMVLSRVKCRVIGREKLPAERFLMVSNHISMYDPLASLAALRGTKVSYISKPENFRIPIVNVFMRHCRFMAIDRDNPRNAMRTINEAAALIQSGEASVGIYPEGTRSKNGELQEFRNGAFKIALKAKSPLVVLRVTNTNKVGRNFPWKRTVVTLEILRVFSYAELEGKSTNEIGALVYDLMANA